MAQVEKSKGQTLPYPKNAAQASTRKEIPNLESYRHVSKENG